MKISTTDLTNFHIDAICEITICVICAVCGIQTLYRITVTHELTPKAVRAAIRAWITAFKILTQEIFFVP